jgi:hypothetical protein
MTLTAPLLKVSWLSFDSTANLNLFRRVLAILAMRPPLQAALMRP